MDGFVTCMHFNLGTVVWGLPHPIVVVGVNSYGAFVKGRSRNELYARPNEEFFCLDFHPVSLSIGGRFPAGVFGRYSGGFGDGGITVSFTDECCALSSQQSFGRDSFIGSFWGRHLDRQRNPSSGSALVKLAPWGN